MSLLGTFKSILFGDDDEDDAIFDKANTAKEPEAKPSEAEPAAKEPETPTAAAPESQEAAWWDTSPGEKPNTVCLQGIDTRQVYLELLNKIKLNKFSVIEIPDTVMKVIQILNKKEFTYQEVEDLFNRSSGLTGEVVKIANSAVYSRGVKISRIRDAMTRLGPNKIKAVLYLHSSRQDVCEDERFVNLARQIIDHCYVVGQIASYLSLRYYPDPDNAFLAGLMHDVGKLGIVKEISDFYEIPETQAEMTEASFGEVIPMLHELSGRFIAKNWNVHEDIEFAIENHHQPNHFLSENETDCVPAIAKQLATLIHVSDIIARMNGRGNYMGNINFFNLPAVQALGITEEPATKDFLREIPRLVTEADAELSASG